MYSTCRNNTRGGGFAIFGPVGGFELSGRLLRWLKSVEWHRKSKPIFGDGFQCRSLFLLYYFRFVCTLYIFFNCVFYTFYKENQGLEEPRETRLEKLMRLLEVSKKMHGGKADLSTKTIFGVHFRSKSQTEKNQGSCSGGWI